MSDTTQTFRVNELFYSLQGEGRWAGRAAIFVRFAQCNLRCPFCDTDFEDYREMTAREIIEAVSAFSPCKFIVLTGGEPTLQATPELIGQLHGQGCYVAMETNGTHPVPEGVDWVTCSPKTAFVDKASLHLKRADELKIIFDGIHPVDTFGIEAQFYYVQPCDVRDPEKNAVILQSAIEFVKSHPEWQLSLQQHKLIHIR